MGKLNIGNISAGLDKVKSITDALSNVAHFELVPIQCIEVADYNPFAENDTDESRYNLAMSIQASGLIEPLAVNKKSESNYKLISGEHRFSAIKQYLDFKQVPCMVFEHISDDEAQLKLYEANGYREYTTEQKFMIYQEMYKLLSKMKDSGHFSGSVQKGIAERLGVSTHQVRKYKRITENLSEEQQQKIINGEISIDNAYQIAKPSPVLTDRHIMDSPDEDEKSGRTSAFDSNPSGNFIPVMTSEDDKNETDCLVPTLGDEASGDEKSGRASAFDKAFWDDKIKSALKSHYDTNSIYLYFTFQVPTTQETIKEILKPDYGYSAGSVVFPDKVSGFCDCRSAQMEIQYKNERTVLTYSQVDSYIREMIRSGEWITKEDAHAAIEENFKI